MYDDDALRALSEDERADLAQRLALLADSVPHVTAEGERRRRHFVDLLVVASVGLIPWTVFLAFTLPRHYVAGHWTTAWVGFDIALLIGLATTAWAGWRRRQVVIAAAIVTGTLLVTDAWFDCMTASSTGDLAWSIADAALVELPLAGLLFWVARRLWRLTEQSTRALAGDTGPVPIFWKVPLYVVDEPAPSVKPPGVRP